MLYTKTKDKIQIYLYYLVNGKSMDIKQRIDELRIKKGWSLSRLALEIGVSDNTVYSWYNEKKYQPSRKTIEDICNVFNITLAEFYSDIDFDKLTSKEIVLLEAFRNVSDEDKQRVIEIVKLFENKQNK